jgi:hypothetical protein
MLQARSSKFTELAEAEAAEVMPVGSMRAAEAVAAAMAVILKKQA